MKEVIKITINERIKILRTQILKNENGKSYSQRKFAEKLGVSPGVINNIDTNLVEAKDNVIKLICLTFNVNEDWLRNGVEPIFKEDSKEEPSIIELLEKQGAKPMVLQIIENYLKMSDDNKKAFDNYLKKLVGVDTYENAHQKAKDNIKNFPTYTDNEKVELVGRDKGKILISKEEYDEIIKNSEKLDPEDYDKYF
ncbi:MAG: helix-turn-helix domain-containing protein [Eubacteriales bacterium]|nr:helix-turn-helix domain-containing protein [Eubacteriales bacterium]